MGLTTRKRAFAMAKLDGAGNREAARAAGYSGSDDSLDRTGRRLAKDPDVTAFLARAGMPEPKAVPQPTPEAPRKQPRATPEPVAAAKAAPATRAQKASAGAIAAKGAPPPDPSEDPLDYMRRVMCDSAEDPKLRLDAAKALAAYTHAKPGEVGKKEQRQKDAEAVGAGRFGLRAVQ